MKHYIVNRLLRVVTFYDIREWGLGLSFYVPRKEADYTFELFIQILCVEFCFQIHRKY